MHLRHGIDPFRCLTGIILQGASLVSGEEAAQTKQVGFTGTALMWHLGGQSKRWEYEMCLSDRLVCWGCTGWCHDVPPALLHFCRAKECLGLEVTFGDHLAGYPPEQFTQDHVQAGLKS